jgi:hypothetical protein
MTILTDISSKSKRADQKCDRFPGLLCDLRALCAGTFSDLVEMSRMRAVALPGPNRSTENRLPASSQHGSDAAGQ